MRRLAYESRNFALITITFRSRSLDSSLFACYPVVEPVCTQFMCTACRLVLLVTHGEKRLVLISLQKVTLHRVHSNCHTLSFLRLPLASSGYSMVDHCFCQLSFIVTSTESITDYCTSLVVFIIRDQTAGLNNRLLYKDLY